MYLYNKVQITLNIIFLIKFILLKSSTGYPISKTKTEHYKIGTRYLKTKSDYTGVKLD